MYNFTTSIILIFSILEVSNQRFTLETILIS